MNDSTEYEKVNAALIQFVQDGWSGKSEKQIECHYGADVAAKTKSVYDQAMDCPVDWNTARMDAALGVLSDFLTTHFPWLTPEARTLLNYRFIVTWK